MDTDMKLTFKVENKTPIELTDLTNALNAFGVEYARSVQRFDDPVADPQAKLYIKEIRSGSVIADLMPYAIGALPLIENFNNVIQFGQYLGACVTYLLSETDEEPSPPMDKQTLENVCQMIEPCAKDGGSNTIISNTYHGNVTVNVNLNSIQANAVQNRAKRKLKEMVEPVCGGHERVVLYWYRTTNDAKKSTGDRAIIESISPKAVKTEATAEVKAKLMWGDDNPLKQAFIVDVMVETIKGVPALYKVYAVHEILPLDGAAA
jgi:hypothetical protein